MLTRTIQILATTARIGIVAPVRIGWNTATRVAESRVLRSAVVASSVATATAGGGWWWMEQTGSDATEESADGAAARSAPRPIPLSPEGSGEDFSGSPAATGWESGQEQEPGRPRASRRFDAVAPASWETSEGPSVSPATASDSETPTSDPYTGRNSTTLQPPVTETGSSLPTDPGGFQPLPPAANQQPRSGGSVLATTGGYAEVAADEATESSATPAEPAAAGEFQPAAETVPQETDSAPTPPAEFEAAPAEPDARAAPTTPPLEDSTRSDNSLGSSLGPPPTSEPPSPSSPARTRNTGRLSSPGSVAPPREFPSTPSGSAATRRAGTAASSGRPSASAVSAAGAAQGFAPQGLATGEAIGALVADTPGERRMEGIQSPTLALEKTAPDEIQVGRPALFEIFVRNIGKVTAHDVVVTDAIPQGTRLVEATPEYQTTAEGLAWSLGTLEPGQEAQLTLQLLPEAEGEIGSVAQVSFRAQASVRTVCTRPELHVEQVISPRVMIGEDVIVSITLSNSGSGAATEVVLEEDVPEGLSHPAGASLEYSVGTLRPGETKSLQLTLRAEAAGEVENVLQLRGEGGVSAEHRAQLEIVAPQLQVAVDGPSRRYLERQVTFDVSIGNPGTAAATNVNLIARLPKGLEFVSADNKGQYDGQQHAVYWSLEELPPQDSGIVKLTAIPVEAGEQRVQVEGQADMGLAAKHEHAMQVEGASQLTFAVTDTADPIEIGAESIYEIRVTNRGAKRVGQVQLAAVLPAGLEALRGEGPTRVVVQGPQISFAPLAQLAPQEEVTYRLFVRGKEDGDQVIRVQLTSDESTTPVTKEESTRVYSDR